MLIHVQILFLFTVLLTRMYYVIYVVKYRNELDLNLICLFPISRFLFTFFWKCIEFVQVKKAPFYCACNQVQGASVATNLLLCPLFAFRFGVVDAINVLIT